MFWVDTHTIYMKFGESGQVNFPAIVNNIFLADYSYGGSEQVESNIS